MNFVSLIEATLFCSLAFYVLVQFGLIFGLWRLKSGQAASTPFVSVIVAARNEQRTIADLLESLVNQTYPNFEIIVVNDRSTDSTADILRSFQKSNSSIKVVTIETVPPAMPPKKNALSEGIRNSQGEILCFTDADCVPPRTWVATLVSFFESGVGVVAGYSPYDATLLREEHVAGPGHRVLYDFVGGEEFKGAIWSAGAIGLRMAWLCTGRNLAYRRSVYDEVGGFERIKMSVSGDDDLFVQLVRRETHWKIRYATSERSFVRTAPPPTFAKFVSQRTRHFSAGRYFALPMKLFFSVFHAANLFLFLGIFAFLYAPSLSIFGFAVLASKFAVDFLLTATGFFLIGERKSLNGFRPLNFLLTEILYIFYNTFIGPLGFITTFEWKQDGKS